VMGGKSESLGLALVNRIKRLNVAHVLHLRQMCTVWDASQIAPSVSVVAQYFLGWLVVC
jgi:hypothetical protein